jgi:polyisoprenyl-phosphate glycosyltransferase
VSTFASGAVPEPGDIGVHPLHFADDTILIVVTGMILASMALLADPIVPSRAET